MTLTVPSSLRKGLQVSAALTAAALLGLTPSSASAKMPNIKRQSDVNISFDLQPLDATSTASGVAKIELEEERKSTKAELEVEVTGLQPGTYSVDATLSDSSTINLGEIVVTGTPVTDTTTTVDDSTGTPEVEVEGEGELEGTLDSTVDARSITTISVSTVPADATTAPVVVLSGDATAETVNLNYFANVRVTAPPASALTTTPSPTDDTTTEVESGKGKGKGKGKGGSKAPKAKKVHGHALAQAKVANGVAKKTFFQFIGFGAPSDANLIVLVNGVDAGTVTSSKEGRVKFRESDLTGTIEFGTLDLVTITTEDGTPVMQADF